MEAHDLEIVIGKDGKVQVRTSGAKGKSCLEYIKLVEQIVGQAESKEMTAEFYEPDSEVRIDAAQQQRQQQRRQG
jgi:hypothetical protein